MLGSFYQYISSFTHTTAASILMVLTLVSLVCIGFMELRLALQLLRRAFIALVSFKVIFKFFRFAFPKMQNIWSTVALFFPLYFPFFLGLFGADGLLLLVDLLFEESFAEDPEPQEIERHLFKDVEQIESPTESEMQPDEGKEDPVELEEDPYGVWPEVALLIIVKLVILVFFY